MHKLTTNELKKVQLEILKVVDKFCKDNLINYWIDCGTLLGAVRHKGYIPWDDDIDVGMLREDYDRFTKLFKEKNINSKYKFYSIENKDDFYVPYGKVLDLTTTLYEPSKEKGIKTNINIDIFVYDNVVNKKYIYKKMFYKRDFFNILNKIQLFSYSPTSTRAKNCIRKFLNKILKFFPKGFFSKKMIKNSKKYSKTETLYIENFTCTPNFICNKKVFDKFIDIEFEGFKFRAMENWDEWLKCMYGDYMKLPPEKDRVNKHNFIAYYNK